MRSVLPICALLLVTPVVAGAAEGVLPIRAGDRVEGEVRYCGDRHVLRIDLVAGEVFRLKVGVSRPLLEDLTVRIYDPTGLDISAPADVRVTNGTTRAGPFAVRESGAHLVQITTFTRHEIPYEASTRVKGRRKRALRVRSGRERRVVAAAGSLLQLRGAQRDATIVLGLPGGASQTLVPGTPSHAALAGGGLTLPTGGTYTLAATGSARAARLLVAAPRRSDARLLHFPDLPDDRGAVASWYDDAGWTEDPVLRAPADHEPPVSRPDPETPAAPPLVLPLSGAPCAPATLAGRDAFADAATPSGHAGGLGMPIAPHPTLDEALAFATVEPFADGPSYVYDIEREGLGTLRYRVHFVVGGRAALAPIVIDGLVAMRWTVEAEAPFHDEAWTLTFDGARGVEVLQGAGTRVTAGHATIHSEAHGFTTPVDGSAPRGELTWGAVTPSQETFLRSEMHDGTGGVTIDVR